MVADLIQIIWSVDFSAMCACGLGMAAIILKQ